MTEHELNAFMAGYERANNSHDLDRVLPFIAEDATYWFTDGTHRGTAAAIARTFAAIPTRRCAATASPGRAPSTASPARAPAAAPTPSPAATAGGGSPTST